MKNQILLIVCLFVSVFSYGQSSSSKVVNSTYAGKNSTECNCFEFSVDQSQYPFHPPNTQVPGYSYFWIWGDGSFLDAESPIDTHCFNGPAGMEFDVQLELTPRKRPGDPTATEYASILTQDSCSNSLLVYNGLEIDVTRVLKIGKEFYVILKTQGCPSGVSNFELTYDAGSLIFIDYLPSTVQYFDNGSAIEFDENDDGIVTHFLKFQCLNNVVHGTVVDFNLSRNSYTNPSCNDDVSLQQTITEGPYDPNILAPSLGRGLTDCDISNKWITYSLQFKNEGLGPTRDSVKVLIRLDNRLIRDSFKMLGVRNYENNSWTRRMAATPSLINGDFTIADNPVSWEAVYNSSNIIGLTCHQMRLEGKSATLETNSYGYVSFKVKVKPYTVLEPWDSLVTEAQVYFDTVSPMPTNLAVTSCAISNVGPCIGNDNCCCKNCCQKPWYAKFTWWLIGVLCLLVLVFWIRKKS